MTTVRGPADQQNTMPFVTANKKITNNNAVLKESNVNQTSIIQKIRNIVLSALQFIGNMLSRINPFHATKREISKITVPKESLGKDNANNRLPHVSEPSAARSSATSSSADGARNTLPVPAENNKEKANNRLRHVPASSATSSSGDKAQEISAGPTEKNSTTETHSTSSSSWMPSRNTLVTTATIFASAAVVYTLASSFFTTEENEVMKPVEKPANPNGALSNILLPRRPEKLFSELMGKVETLAETYAKDPLAERREELGKYLEGDLKIIGKAAVSHVLHYVGEGARKDAKVIKAIVNKMYGMGKAAIEGAYSVSNGVKEVPAEKDVQLTCENNPLNITRGDFCPLPTPANNPSTIPAPTAMLLNDAYSFGKRTVEGIAGSLSTTAKEVMYNLKGRFFPKKKISEELSDERCEHVCDIADYPTLCELFCPTFVPQSTCKSNPLIKSPRVYTCPLQTAEKSTFQRVVDYIGNLKAGLTPVSWAIENIRYYTAKAGLTPVSWVIEDARGAMKNMRSFGNRTADLITSFVSDVSETARFWRIASFVVHTCLVSAPQLSLVGQKDLKKLEAQKKLFGNLAKKAFPSNVPSTIENGTKSNNITQETCPLGSNENSISSNMTVPLG